MKVGIEHLSIFIKDTPASYWRGEFSTSGELFSFSAASSRSANGLGGLLVCDPRGM